MSTYTTNYNLIKYAKGYPDWDVGMNNNLDIIDAKIKEAIDGINASHFIVGEVRSFAFSTVPTKWLECNGASLLRANYPDLFAAIGTAFGTADATHFNIPDMRGKFPRGWDHGAGNDPDAASRTAQATGGATGDNVGSLQSDDYKKHKHKWGTNGKILGTAAYPYNEGWIASNNFDNDTSEMPLSGGNETRPININLLFCIYAGV